MNSFNMGNLGKYRQEVLYLTSTTGEIRTYLDSVLVDTTPFTNGLKGTQPSNLHIMCSKIIMALTGAIATFIPTAVAITGGSAVGLTDLGATFTNISGTPGSGTANTPSGKAAFAATGSSVVVTCSKCTANSKVFIQLGGTDATLTSVRCTPAAGSFTVTGNAAATGITPFTFLVVN